MRLDENKCEYQTMSLFGDVPKAASQPVKTAGHARERIGHSGDEEGFPLSFDDFDIKLTTLNKVFDQCALVHQRDIEVHHAGLTVFGQATGADGDLLMFEIHVRPFQA